MSFFAELKRRNVVRAGAAYAAIGWAVAQVVDFAFETFGAPDWVLKSLVIVLILGLPVVLIIAWAFELTPEGIKRERDVDRSASNTRHRNRRFDRLIIGVLVLAVGLLLIDRFYTRNAADPDDVGASADLQSIAVLPFENLSDDDNFTDGLTEEIQNVLAKNRDLLIAGRTSSFAFKGKNPSAAEVGEALNVDHFLAGSVRRSGPTLRITARLTDVTDGFQVWSETYDRELADIFDIQDEIAGAIARELHLRLAPSADRPTDSIDAYVKYVEALAIHSRQPFPTEPIDRLISEVLILDPGFAKAYELRAILFWIETGSTLDGETVRQMVNDAAISALELDDSLTAARYLERISSPGTTWRREFDAIEAALAEAPTNFSLNRFYCYDLRVAGYYREAVQCARRLVELEPLAASSHWVLGMGLSTQGRYEEARDSYRRAIEQGANHWWDIGFSYLVEGRFELAIEAYEQFGSTLGWEPENIRLVVEAASDPETGGIFLEQWIAENVGKATTLDERFSQYYWYLAFGRLDPYFEIIEENVSKAGGFWHDAENLQHEGVLYRSAGYTRHPGYLRAGEKSGLIELWETRGAPDYCSKESGEWVCE